MLVSCYTNIKHTTDPKNVDYYEILEAIKLGAWRDEVVSYRALPDDSKPAQQAKKKAKLALPNFTGSGIFGDNREDDAIIQHSGRIIIDLDHIGDVAEAKSLLCADDYTECCFVSVGGAGIAVSVKIDPNRHRESFLALSAYYKNRYNYIADKSCVNEARVRFISYDPELFLNPDAKQFIVGRDYVAHVKRVTAYYLENAQPGEVHGTLIRSSRLMGGYIAGGLIDEEEGLEHLVDIMRNKEGIVSIEIERKKIKDGIANGKLSPITAENIARSERDNEAEREKMKEIYSYIHMQNREGIKFTPDMIRVICEKYSVDIHGITFDRIESIFKEVYENNVPEFGINHKSDIVKVEVFLTKNYRFYNNVVTSTIEVYKAGVKDPEYLDENTIFRHMQHAGFKFPLDKLKSLLKSDFVEKYNPFIDHFTNLPKWDGKDHIEQLAGYVHTDFQDHFNTQFKKMLVRSVGCGLYGVENRFVFVLVQEKQYTGKSSFIRFLNPFGTKYYTEAPLREGKDSFIGFSENFIYNLEELASLSNRDVNGLKAIISTAMIKERRPYAKKAEEMPRRCNFFASTNSSQFLTDVENTRWLAFNVKNLDWGYKKEVDINQVWAQAFALWHDKDFDSQLTKEESRWRDVNNKAYEVSDLDKELLKRLYIVCDEEDAGTVFVSTVDVVNDIMNIWKGPAAMVNSRLIGKSMVQLGFKQGTRRINGHQYRGYFVKRNAATSNDPVLSTGAIHSPKLF